MPTEVRMRGAAAPRMTDAEAARNKEIGRRLRAARLAAGFSLKDMSERAGVHLSSIGKYEAGEQRIPASHVHAVAKACGVPLASLFGDDAVFAGDPPEMAELARSFERIPNARARRAILALARQIAERDARG